MIIRKVPVLALAVCLMSAICMAQEQGTSAKSVAEIPDGVSHVKTNPDGSLKSLVVKATSDIDADDADTKARREARNSSKQDCRTVLTKWLLESGKFYLDSKGAVVFVQAAKDAPAPANLTPVEVQQARALAIACGGELLVLANERADASAGQSYVTVMGLKGTDIPSPDKVRQEAKGADSQLSLREIRPAGPPRSLEDDAPRRPALRRLAAEAEPATPEKSAPAAKLEDFL